MAAFPNLHIPDEPTGRANAWLASILDGNDLSSVLLAEDGFVQWQWSRWSSLGRSMTHDEFADIVVGYRREIWLWLAGERIWAQCCSGLLGRVTRRIPQDDAVVS